METFSNPSNPSLNDASNYPNGGIPNLQQNQIPSNASSSQNNSLPTPFALRKMGLHTLEEGLYVFQTVLNCDRSKLAASASNNIIKLFNPETFDCISQLQGHTSTINELSFSSTHPDVLFSCSSDKTVRIWDTRANAKGPIYRGDDEFFSFSLSTNETNLASGCSGTVKLWDIRTTKLVRDYPGYHSEDITQVRFHPTQPTHLFSGSIDGMISMFDITQEDEEDSLVGSINADDAVSKIAFFGANYEFLLCHTTSEKLSAWDFGSVRLRDFGDIRQFLAGSVPVEYLISIHYVKQTNEVFLVAGNHQGTISIWMLTNGSPALMAVLAGGHTDTVRSVEWIFDRQTIFTSGEDSRISCWTVKTGTEQTAQVQTPTPVVDEFRGRSLKMPSPMRLESTLEKKPYSKAKPKQDKNEKMSDE